MKDISRRTALTGAAWSVPIVALTVAAPAAAASGEEFEFVSSEASWNTANGYLSMHTYLYQGGVPAPHGQVTFTILPSGQTYTTATQGSGYGEYGTFDAPPTATVVITSGSQSVTITPEGTPPPASEYTLYQARAARSSSDVLDVEVFVYYQGAAVPVGSAVPVHVTLLPDNIVYDTTTYGFSGYASLTATSVPATVTQCRIEAGDCVRTYDVLPWVNPE